MLDHDYCVRRALRYDHFHRRNYVAFVRIRPDLALGNLPFPVHALVQAVRENDYDAEGEYNAAWGLRAAALDDRGARNRSEVPLDQ